MLIQSITKNFFSLISLGMLFFLFFYFNILSFINISDNLLLFPLIGILILILIIVITPFQYINYLKNLTFFLFSLNFLTYLLIFSYLQNLFSFFAFSQSYKLIEFFNLTIIFFIDNLNIFFLLLITLLMPICLLISWTSIKFNFKLYLVILLLLEFFLLATFLSYNLFFFYFFFECTLIPMFLLIGIWGSRQRKIHAVYQFFFYTVFGSVLLLIGMLILYYSAYTLNIDLLNNIKIKFELQLIVWILLFIGFCVKIPMVPFHIWLPEAHVEAPTAGSVILAGVLLKVGSYGILRFIVPLFPVSTFFFSPFIYLFSIISIIYISCIAIRQIDMKKIIAYSSIAHMNFIILGIFSLTLQGVSGSIYLMLSHGIVSSALFIAISIIYDRYHSRLITYYSNLVIIMPIYSVSFFLLILANISFPGTSNFIGELFVLLGIIEENFLVTIFAVFSIILSAIYSIWLINRILFGQSKNFLISFSDLNKREFFILFLMLFLIFFFGLFSRYIFNIFELNILIFLIKFI